MMGIRWRAGVLRFDNQLRYGLRLPSSRELVGVYIDDLLVLLQVRRADASRPDLDPAICIRPRCLCLCQDP